LSYRGERLEHHNLVHSASGVTLRNSRPDFQLFHFLWAKRLIGEEDYNELRSGNHNLTRPPATVVRIDNRRERYAQRPQTQALGRPQASLSFSRPPTFRNMAQAQASTRIESTGPTNQESVRFGTTTNISSSDRNNGRLAPVVHNTTRLLRDTIARTSTLHDQATETVVDQDHDQIRETENRPSDALRPRDVVKDCLASDVNTNGLTDSQVDSGYHSRSHGATADTNVDDTASIISIITNASRIQLPTEEKEHVISAFACDICQDVDFLEYDANARERMLTRLPDIIKSFAMRLESVVTSKQEHDAKEFLRQQRV
jgi:hypothetical protein